MKLLSRLPLCLLICFMAGCGHNEVILTPRDGGPSASGETSGWGSWGDMTVQAGGEDYNGTWNSGVYDSTGTLISSLSDATVGYATGASLSTGSAVHNTALLEAADDSMMNCQFDSYPAAHAASGVCRDSEGKTYDMRIGSPPPAAAPSSLNAVVPALEASAPAPDAAFAPSAESSEPPAMDAPAPSPSAPVSPSAMDAPAPSSAEAPAPAAASSAPPETPASLSSLPSFPLELPSPPSGYSQSAP